MSCSCLSSIKSYVATRNEAFTTHREFIERDGVRMQEEVDRYQFNWAEKTGNALLFPMDWVFKTYDASDSCMVKAALITLSIFTAIIGLIGALFKKLGEMANPCSSMRSECLNILHYDETTLPDPSVEKGHLLEVILKFIMSKEGAPQWMGDACLLDGLPPLTKQNLLTTGKYKDTPKDATQADLKLQKRIRTHLSVFENEVVRLEEALGQGQNSTLIQNTLGQRANNDAGVLTAMERFCNAYFSHSEKRAGLECRTERLQELYKEMAKINIPAQAS